MKAQTKVCAARVGDLGLKPDQFRVSKSKSEPTMSDAEMLACFAKLKDLVPTIPTDRKISRVALLQHVIDYILDLELTLEHHPAMTPPPQLLAVAAGERKPLGESAALNTLLQVGHRLGVPYSAVCTAQHRALTRKLQP